MHWVMGPAEESAVKADALAQPPLFCVHRAADNLEVLGAYGAMRFARCTVCQRVERVIGSSQPKGKARGGRTGGKKLYTDGDSNPGQVLFLLMEGTYANHYTISVADCGGFRLDLFLSHEEAATVGVLIRRLQELLAFALDVPPATLSSRWLLHDSPLHGSQRCSLTHTCHGTAAWRRQATSNGNR